MTLASASGLSRSLLQVLLLILSQDTSFANIVHKIYLPDVPWYKEQQVGGRGEGGGEAAGVCVHVHGRWCFSAPVRIPS